MGLAGQTNIIRYIVSSRNGRILGKGRRGTYMQRMQRVISLARVPAFTGPHPDKKDPPRSPV